MRAVGVLIVTVLVCLAVVSGPVRTQPITPRAALERLFTADRMSADWFTPAFLAAAPLARVEQIVADLKRTQGIFQRVEEDGTQFLVVFERALVPTRITLDANGRIAGLFFFTPRARASGLEQVVGDLRTLPGRVSLLVLEDGRERVALNPETPLAVGSAFKLAVLAALLDQIRAGQRSWRDLVELRPEWKSLPSGILQDWPDGSPLSLHTLASLMISRSDNTATDALIHTVGRAAVEAFAPARNRPFLTTREAFVLKTPRYQDLLARYRGASEPARRALLAEIQNRPLPPVEEIESALNRGPLAIDVEWFFNARELCAAMARVADLPLMGINPGLASRRDWAHIAFKGGSEPGVLNFTTAVVARNQRTYCVAASWNNDAAALDQQRLFGLYGAILDLLK